MTRSIRVKFLRRISRCGDQGFGFDPMFIPNGHNRTFGEMPYEEKAPISHRADAFAKFTSAARALNHGAAVWIVYPLALCAAKCPYCDLNLTFAALMRTLGHRAEARASQSCRRNAGSRPLHNLFEAARQA